MMKLVQDDSVAGSRPQRAGVWKMEGESNVGMGRSKPITIFWEFLGYPGSPGFDAEPFRKIRLQQTLKFGMQEDTQHYIVYKRRTTMNS